MDTLLVLTNLPDEASAERLAGVLVEQRLAACITIFPGVRSVYRWQGVIERAGEVPLLIKTAADRFDALCTAIRAHHPYELPEIVAVDIATGLPEYLAWVHAETRPAGEQADLLVQP